MFVEVDMLVYFKLDFMLGKYLIFIGFSKAHEFIFARIKDHVIIIEPVLWNFKIFFQIFSNLVEISAISIKSIIISVVTDTASSQEAENIVNEISGPSSEPCSTPL